MVNYSLPAHTISYDGTIEYLDQYKGTMPLLTPIVALNTDLTIQQEVSKDGGQNWYKTLEGTTKDTFTYRVTLTNHSDHSITTTVSEVFGDSGLTPDQIMVDSEYDISRFSPGLTIDPRSAYSNGFVTLSPGQSITFVYSLTYNQIGDYIRNAYSDFLLFDDETRYIWDGTVVSVSNGGGDDNNDGNSGNSSTLIKIPKTGEYIFSFSAFSLILFGAGILYFIKKTRQF